MEKSIQNHTVRELFLRYSASLLAFATKRVGSQDAEDVMQEAYVRLLAYPDRQAIRYPQAFLFKTVSNVAIDLFRKRQTASLHCSSDYDLEYEAISTLNTDPEASVAGAFELVRFRSALAELPELSRDIFLLHRVDGLKQTEIASMLGVTVRTVERNIAKAFKHLNMRMID